MELPGRRTSSAGTVRSLPSFSANSTDTSPFAAVGISPLLLANASLSPGDTTSVYTLEASGVELVEAKEVRLIYDAKGRAVKEDSFFEAYARETLSAFFPPELRLFLVVRLSVNGTDRHDGNSTEDVKFVAVNHFVELQFNGLVRRCIVASAKGTTASPPVPSTSTSSPTSSTPKERIFVVSSTTEITFQPPPAASSASKRERSSNAKDGKKAGGAQGGLGAQGELPGYESIGGMESQIEQIREMVEWPLTRPELYSHFGSSPLPFPAILSPRLLTFTACRPSTTARHTSLWPSRNRQNPPRLRHCQIHPFLPLRHQRSLALLSLPRRNRIRVAQDLPGGKGGQSEHYRD